MKLDFEISRKQQRFLNATETEVFFGGAAGGGKSFGQLIDALIFAFKYPKSRQLILRRTFPELSRSLIRVSQEIYPRNMGKYKNSSHCWEFRNGSQIEFGHVQKETDVYKYQSAEYDVIRFDELTHFTESIYVYLISRVRGVNDFPKQLKSTGNPGGIGHSWVKERFIDIAPADKPFTIKNAVGLSGLYIPARVTDNPFLLKKDPNYVKRLEALPMTQRKALLDGDWNIFEGQYFAEWEPDKHVIKPFIIPKEWKKYIALDFGRDMTAALWIAVDFFGNSYVYREFCSGEDGEKFKNGICEMTPLTATEASAEILKRTPKSENISFAYAPNDLFAKTGQRGESSAELFARAGLPLVKANNERVQGWYAVAERLKIKTTETGVKAPSLRIFENCRVLISSLPALQYSKVNPNDVANEPHHITHAPDALRYFFAGRPQKAELPKIDNPFEPDESSEESFLNFGM